MTPLRVVVVEDQPLAREHLVTLLKAEAGVDVVAECAHGAEALEVIPRVGPDLVFLDVQMPEMSGFDVIEAIGVHDMPPVVFVTAFDKYALKAFEVHAFDYLLKPFGPGRLTGVVARARKTLPRRDGSTRERFTRLLDTPAIANARERLVIRSGGRVLFVARETIDCVEADGNYVYLHTDRGRYHTRDRMAMMEARLGESFARIHRSTLVNLRSIAELQVAGGGEYDVVMKSGARFRVSRLHRPELERRLRSLD
ncbi:MAG TPA: response regulator [Vicinamibacterales bacterium]